MVVNQYHQGDIVWIDMDPALGHEQQGRRPAIVVSGDALNARINMLWVCPITSQQKEYPMRVSLQDTHQITGFVLCDQIKSVDPQERKVEYIESADRQVLGTVLGTILAGLK